MKYLLSFLIKSPIIANLLMVIIIVTGILNLRGIRKTLFPKIKSTEIHITSNYHGGSAEVVENNITRKIEKELQGLPNVKKLTSVSTESISYINLKLDSNLKEREIEKLMNKVRSKLNLVTDFPQDFKKNPTVEVFNLEDLPIITIGIKKSIEPTKALRLLKKLKRDIKRLPLITRVESFGEKKHKINIALNPSTLIEKNLSLEHISNIIQERFYLGNIGSIQIGKKQKNLIYKNTNIGIEEIENTIIQSNFSGEVIKLKEIGKVTKKSVKRKSIFKLNGEEVLGLIINKNEKADMIKAVNSVLALTLPYGSEVTYADDLSRYIKASYKVVESNAILGFLVVFIILCLFLNWRTAFWVSMGIPISILMALMAFRALGFSIDVISLSGMILVLGILVDDAIVVAEAIEYEIESGLNREDAAIAALKKVALPLIASVLTTIIAFSPLFFLSGEDGDFLFVLPLIVVAVLSASLFESLFILPSHLSSSTQAKPKKRIIFSKVKSIYSKALNFVLSYPKIALIEFVCIFGLTLFFAQKNLKMIVYPQEGAEEFSIYLSTPASFSLERTAIEIKKVESILNKYLDKEILSFSTHIGNFGDDVNFTYKSKINVSLVPFSERDENALQLSEVIKNKIKKLNIFTEIRFDIDDIGPAETKSLFITIISDNDFLRQKVAKKIKDELLKIENSTDFEKDDELLKEAIEIKLKKKEISKLNISVQKVLIGINQLMEGLRASINQSGNKKIPVHIEVKNNGQNISSYLDQLSIQNNEGTNIKIAGLFSLNKSKQIIAINHYNSERGVKMGINYNLTTKSEKSLIERIKKIAQEDGKDDVYLQFGGNYSALEKTSNDGLQAFLLGIFCVFCILVILFNSLIKPLLVLTAIPFGVLGVLWIHLFHNIPLSFPGILGLVGLIGVVVNDSILLITEFFYQLKINLGDAKLSITKAAKIRLRPILLTTLTTSLGLIPLGYGLGGIDPFNAPMALSLGWGILISTPLILFILPCLLFTLYNKES